MPFWEYRKLLRPSTFFFLVILIGVFFVLSTCLCFFYQQLPNATEKKMGWMRKIPLSFSKDVLLPTFFFGRAKKWLGWLFLTFSERFFSFQKWCNSSDSLHRWEWLRLSTSKTGWFYHLFFFTPRHYTPKHGVSPPKKMGGLGWWLMFSCAPNKWLSVNQLLVFLGDEFDIDIQNSHFW